MNKTIIKSDTIDLANLVTNSNTDFTKAIQTKLIKKIDEEFNEDEKKWYVANLFMYLNYDSTNDFPINLENIFDLIGFANKSNAKRSLVNNFTINEDYKITVLPKYEGKFSTEEIMLNIDTFKSLCMIVKTEKAKKIRKYYVKLEKIVNIVINEDLEEKKEKQKLIEDELRLQLKCKDNEHLYEKKSEKNKYIIEKLRNKKCIYLIELSENLIKIGSTENIEQRIKDLKKLFKLSDIFFLDVFESENFRDIELMILKEETVKNNLYNEKINDHKSREVVKLNNDFTYNNLIAIINLIIKNYNNPLNLTPSQLLEYKKIELINKLIDKDYKLNEIKTILETEQCNISTKNDIISEKENNNIQYNENTIHKTDIRICASRTNPILQLNINDLSIFKTYKGYSEILALNLDYTHDQIYRAIKNNKIYKNFRWCFQGDEINPTVETKKSTCTESIIELNKTKTSITNSFSTKKDMQKHLNIGRHSLDKIISNCSLYKNSYYIMYSDCSKNLLENYKNPINFYKPINSVKIKQINPITKEEIIFKSISEVCRKFSISNITLNDVIKEKTIYKCFLWDYTD